MKHQLLFAALLLAGCKSKEEVAVAKSEQAIEAVASDEIYAASAHLRVVDPRSKSVVGKIDLQRAVRNLEFSPDGKIAYVAASDGLRAIDADARTVSAKLTEHPARYVELDETGSQVFVLEHQVNVLENGVRDISAFSLVTIDARTGLEMRSEEVGQRILYAHAPTAELYGLIIDEAGQVGLVKPGQAMKSPTPMELSKLVPAESRMRNFPVIRGTTAYLPLEAEPARIIRLDLKTGQADALSLPGLVALRGLGISPDGKWLYASSGTSIHQVELATGKTTKALEPSGASTGAVIGGDGRFLYAAQTVDGTGGAVLVINLETFKEVAKIHLDDISPWAIQVRPRAAYAHR